MINPLWISDCPSCNAKRGQSCTISDRWMCEARYDLVVHYQESGRMWTGDYSNLKKQEKEEPELDPTHPVSIMKKKKELEERVTTLEKRLLPELERATALAEKLQGEVTRLKAGLRIIAYGDCSCLSANPAMWCSEVAKSILETNKDE